MTASVSVSALGTWSYNVGIAIYAYQVTNSTSWVAAATVGRYVPALLFTWFGAGWIDRFAPRLVAVAGDLVCAVAMVLITVVAVLHAPLAIAIALAAVSSAAARVQSSAVLTVAADVIVESQLIRSTALINTAEAMAAAVGSGLASLVLTVYSPSVLFAINGATFVVSALLLRAVDAPGSGQRTTAAASRTAAAEIAYQAARRVAWPLIATRATAALVYGFDVVLLAVVATSQLHEGTTGYGLMLAAAGVGGLLVALALRRSSGIRAVVMSALGMAIYALPLAIFALHPPLAADVATQLVRGAGRVIVTATAIGCLQRAVPSSVSGRIFRLTNAAVLAGTCAGALLATAALDSIGLATALVLAAFLPFVIQLFIVPGLLRFDRDGAAALATLDPRVDTLRRLDLFQNATRATLYEVADNAIEVEIQPGQEIVREGDTADALYVLTAGAVEVTKQSDAGPVTLRELTAPAYFGEIGLIHEIPRTATVSAIGASTVWRIPSSVFLAAASRAGISGALSETAQLRVKTEASISVATS
jgi:Cyclic nucleotide-binding domain/Major Facilitator Superfamily